jgi:hypothetical protein
MPRRLSLLALAAALALPATADVLVLSDGRKLSGSVKEKPDGYEIVVEGQTLGFGKEDVARWVKSPKDLTADAEKSYEEAKKIYTEAVGIEDDKKAEARMREALPKVTKAREGYAEARDLFPEGHADLDAALVNVMKLMRLVREKLGSQIASGGAPPAAPPVVTPKEEPPPPPPAEVKPTATPADAWMIVADPVRRADPGTREGARALLKSQGGELAVAAGIFLSRDDFAWGLVEDVVEVKGGGTYRGRLQKRSDVLQVLVQDDRREVRIRKAADAVYVAPPGASETKAAEVKITAAAPSEAFGALQEYLTKLEPASDVVGGLAALAARIKELKGKGADVDALVLFAAGHASGLLMASKGAPAKELEAVFKDLGWAKSEYGPVWGTSAALAMDDYRKWMASGEYGLAVVQFQSEYKAVPDLNVRYALGLLMVLKALADNRGYAKAAVYLELQARSAPTAPSKEHLLALAKSVREASPCMACGGSNQVNCATCKGKIKINVQCGKCGGSGKINSLRGIVTCSGCAGQGTFKNVNCPKCKATGKVECKARGCDKPVKPPTFESFAEAYKCGLCRGQGGLLRHVASPCPDCAGIGLILQPKADPTKLLR